MSSPNSDIIVQLITWSQNSLLAWLGILIATSIGIIEILPQIKKIKSLKIILYEILAIIMLGSFQKIIDHMNQIYQLKESLSIEWKILEPPKGFLTQILDKFLVIIINNSYIEILLLIIIWIVCQKLLWEKIREYNKIEVISKNKINDEKIIDSNKKNNLSLNFFEVLNSTDLDKKILRDNSQRNLTLAGFTLTSSSLLITLSQKTIEISSLVSLLYISTLIFFLSSLMSYEADYFWQSYLSDILQYLGILILMFSFTIFLNSYISSYSLQYVTYISFFITILYFIRGIYILLSLWNNIKKINRG
jgi:ABC-type multidrug transport system permease subunit